MKFKRLSITTKLFVSNALIFILFLSFTLVGQRVFLESTYNADKRKELTTSVSTFAQEYNSSSNYEDLLEKMKNLEDTQNTYIAIYNLNLGRPMIYQSGIPTVDNSKVQFILEIFNELKTNENYNDRLSKNKQVNFSILQKSTNIQVLVSIKRDKSSENLIIGYTSLQPVSDALSIVEKFYRYFSVAAMVIIIIITLVFARLVTKPLKKINDGATRMANLDFSENLKVGSEDEIGSLALSLNILSYNLSNALTSLTDANEKLRKDIEKERKLEQMRKDFIAAASHELKTPITLIKGYAEGIKDDIFEGEERDSSLEVIIDESEKMGKLVEEMLELSALENETLALNKIEFNIKYMIEREVKKFQNEIDKRSITVYREYRGEKGYGDEFKVNEVITNLFSNGIRHCPENGHIWIYTKNDSESLYVSIENDGDKIPEEEQDKIWSKFYKIDKSRDRSLGGTGLGLSIVNNIIRLHKGSYGVTNTDRGVKFYFTIPLN